MTRHGFFTASNALSPSVHGRSQIHSFLTQLHQNTTIIITFVLLNGILKNITSQRVVHDVNNSEYQYHCAFTFAFKAELYVRANATKTE